MNPFEHELLETRLLELDWELDRDARTAYAGSILSAGRPGVRANVATWLVRAGLWLDPRIEERMAPAQSDLAHQL